MKKKAKVLKMTDCNGQELKYHRRPVEDKVVFTGSKHLARHLCCIGVAYSRKKSYCCAFTDNLQHTGR